VFLLLIVHFLVDFHRLRGLDYHRQDPLVAHVLGLTTLPDVSTVSRTLSDCYAEAVQKVRSLIREVTLACVVYEDFFG